MDWSDEKEHYVNGGPAPPPPQPASPAIQSGICARFGTQLSALPPSEWSGRLVRPVHLPSSDPGSYAVVGGNSHGLCGNSPIPRQMAERLPEALRPGATYVTYNRSRYTPTFCTTQQCKGLKPELPLAKTIRISRHWNASIVSLGE